MSYEDFITIFPIKNIQPIPGNQELSRVYNEIYQLQQILQEIKRELEKIDEFLQLLWEYMHEHYLFELELCHNDMQTLVQPGCSNYIHFNRLS